MQRVKDLYDELGAPGQQKLWLEARKRKIAVTKTQVNEFVQRQAERQVFSQPLPRAEGKSASEGGCSLHERRSQFSWGFDGAVYG